MKICVYGLWHLGSVTAACLAQLGHEVVAIDPDLSRVQLCKEGTMPLFEPGLSELSTEGVRAGRLNYTADLSAVKDAEVVWVTLDRKSTRLNSSH